jgi:signal transduction histidine kinase
VPSRDNKARGGVAVDQAPAREAREASPAPAEAAAPPPQSAKPAPDAARSPGTSRRALKNWRVRSRLLLLITIPTLTAVVLGGTRIVTSVQGALNYQRIETLANLSSAVTTLAGKMEDERDQTVIYIADGSSGRAAALANKKAAAAAQLQLVQEQYAFTAPWVAKVRSQVGGIGSSYPVQVQQDAAAITSVLSTLPDLRKNAIDTKTPASNIVVSYTNSIDQLLGIDDDIALDSGDPTLASSVRSLSTISRIEEEASEQRAYLSYALTRGSFGPGVLSALTTAQAQMNDNISEFQSSGTQQQVTLYNTTVSGSLVDLARSYEATAINDSAAGVPLSSSPTTAEEWWGAQSGMIGAMRKVEQNLVAASVNRATALRRNAIIDAIAVGAAIIIVLGLALILTTLVGRSMVRPLRRLRAGALEVAGLQLPETVRRMSESDGSGAPITVAPIDVDSTDEIGEVARAFDQVHREALRLAANEAALRGNVNAMFVNLSRRSQSLVERQIRLIDDLEQGEQDDERLGSLFQMDHLATRMRRNSENLLVLAGHDSSRRWNQPVALVDVLRAAVSEIEQYERVSLNVQPGISVRGHAVNDAVHLLAELAENATSFSSAETPVTISGHLLSSGGVLLDITDQGVGMGAEEMAHANWRLDNPPTVDVSVSRRMGLFVVARLAARHGIRVRLRSADSGGLTALVWLPDEVVSRDGASPSGRMPGAADGAINVTMPGMSDTNGRFGADDLSAAAQEVNAARTPKFAPLQAHAGENGNSPLGRRTPGAGPRPGAGEWAASPTGPLPAIPASPQRDDGTEPWATSPQPAISADSFGNGLGSTGPAGSELASSGFSGTGSLPAIGRDSWASWPDPIGSQPPASPSLAPSPSGEPPSGILPRVDLTADEPPAERPEAPAGSAGSPAASGNGSKLPKRQVADRSQSGDSGVPGPAGSTDMFASTARNSRPGGPAAGGQPSESASPGPAATPEPPDASEFAGAGFAPQPPFRAPEPLNGGASVPAGGSGTPNGFNGTTNGANGNANGNSGGYSWDAATPADEVVVPPAEHTTEYRLPIFEAVESDWFRRGRNSVGWAPQEQAAEPESANWSSPADEGWQAAAAVAAAPSSSGVTSAGLPKRVPRANLVPGTAGSETSSAPAPAPARSASATRDRFASFQRGSKEGRAAASSDNSSAGEDDGSR